MRRRMATIVTAAVPMALAALMVVAVPSGATPSPGAVPAGHTIQLTVAGQAGVPGDASAVVLNVTVTDPAVPGFLTVYPCGQPRPLASNVNYVAGQNVPNLVIAKVGADRQVCIYSLQTADVIVDVSGYFPPGAAFSPIANPQRILDTRNGTGAPARLGAGQVLALHVAGVAGVPADALAVVVNTTVTGPSGPGFLTVWPCGQPQPLASNLNYVAGQTVPNLVVAKLGAGGQLCMYSLAATDVVADVAGYFPAGSDFTPIINPQRILDTRSGLGAPAGPVAAGAELALPVGGVAGVPPDASAVVLNVTATNPAAPGFVTVWPCGEPRPVASNLNYEVGQTVPNAVIAKLGAGGRTCLSSLAATDLVVDVAGYFPAGSAFVPVPNPRRILDTRPVDCPFPAAAAGIPAGYPCDGTVVTDIDGDGAPDLFAIYNNAQDPLAIDTFDEYAAAEVRGTWYSVHLGDVDLLGTNMTLFRYGAYDPSPGNEVLVVTGVTNHAVEGSVIGWSGSGLERFPDDWTVDTGLYFGAGIRCVAGGIDVPSYGSSPEDAVQPTAADLDVDHYVWQGRALVKTGTDTRTVPLAPGQYPADVAFDGGDAFDCPQLLVPNL